jgi:putative tryptophan/tyrosine transport system substrate-binding protein
MRRRDFITLLGGAATWPLAARAQHPAVPVIGYLNTQAPAGYARYVSDFQEGLRETGFIEGRNVSIEYRWADGQYDRLPGLAADLVRRQVAVICGATSGAAQAAQMATTTIPIVFSIGGDPVAMGLVVSLNRPGGNLTGVANLNTELTPKRFELLRELIPGLTAIGALVNPSNPNADFETRDMRQAASALGLQLHLLRAGSERDLDMDFATLVQLHAGGLVVGPDPFFNSCIEYLAALALRHALPTIYQFPEFVAAGGLMSYSGSLADMYRLVGLYTGRILKGAKPAELPIQRPTKVELLINLRTAKALGITVPITLLARADDVIE